MDCITGAHESDMHTPNQRSSSFAIIVVFMLIIFQMHDSTGAPILALPPVSNLYDIKRVHVLTMNIRWK
jgi:hypothetical protein